MSEMVGWTLVIVMRFNMNIKKNKIGQLHTLHTVRTIQIEYLYFGWPKYIGRIQVILVIVVQRLKFRYFTRKRKNRSSPYKFDDNDDMGVTDKIGLCKSRPIIGEHPIWHQHNARVLLNGRKLGCCWCVTTVWGALYLIPWIAFWKVSSNVQSKDFRQQRQ